MAYCNYLLVPRYKKTKAQSPSAYHVYYSWAFHIYVDAFEHGLYWPQTISTIIKAS